MSNHVILVDDDSFYAEILGDLLTMQGLYAAALFIRP